MAGSGLLGRNRRKRGLGPFRLGKALRRDAGRACLVGAYDFLHERMPDDVAIGELDETDTLDVLEDLAGFVHADRKSTRLNSSHSQISYAVFCLKTKKLTDAGA